MVVSRRLYDRTPTKPNYTLTAKDPKQRFGIRRISRGLLSGGLLSGGLVSRATDFESDRPLACS